MRRLRLPHGGFRAGRTEGSAQEEACSSYLARLLARIALLGTWWTPVLVLSLVFVTSWPLMALAEPAGSAIADPANYWWYFVVTAATVGYGDLYPESAAGHAVGVYVIVGGIATLTTVFARLSTALEKAKGRRMQGAITVEMLRPHRAARLHAGTYRADGGASCSPTVRAASCSAPGTTW